MGGDSADPRLLFAVLVIIFAALPIYFALLRSSMRLVFLYVYIGVVLVEGGLLGAVVAFPLTEGITVSAGSVAYGALMMSALLLVVVGRDVQVIRNTIRIVVAVNVFKIGLFSLMGAALGSASILNPFDTSASVFSVSLRIVITGGVLIVAELLLLIWMLERYKTRVRDIRVLCVLFFVGVLCLDGVLFPLLAFTTDPGLLDTIVNGVKAKLVLALSYSVPLTAFLFGFPSRMAQYEATPLQLQELIHSPKDDLIEEIGRRQDALESSEDNYRRLAESIGDIMFSIDDEMRLTYWNPAAERTGRTKEEVLGRMHDEVFPQTKGSGLEEFYRQVLRTQAAGRFVHEVQRGDQQLVYEVSAFPFRGGATVLARDITQRRLEERERERSAVEKRGLLAAFVRAQEEERRVLASDLHDDSIQVLSATRLELTALEEQLDDSDQRRRLRRLDHALKDAAGRMRSQIFDLRPPSLDGSGLVMAVTEYLEVVSERDGLATELVNHLRREPDPEMRAIAYRIMREALVNVIKHARAGRVTVSLDDRDGGMLVRVRDDGVGFSPEDRRLAAGHIGLASMRERAELVGGWWRVESAPGAGTTVEFFLPFDAAAPTPAGPGAWPP